jgi:hypothetical protein
VLELALFVELVVVLTVAGGLLLLQAPANTPVPTMKVARPIRAYERILIAVSSTDSLRVSRLQLEKHQ